jgi:2'-5' RNA ligase
MKEEKLYKELTKQGINAISNGKVRPIYTKDRKRANKTLSLYADIDKYQTQIYRNVINLIPKSLLNTFSKHKLHEASYLHINVFMFIDKNSRIAYTKHDLESYKEISKKVLKDYKEIQIKFRGFGVSDTTLFIKGYLDENLIRIRKELEERVKQRNLPFDPKYEQIGAHLSLVRWRRNFTHKETNQLTEFIKHNYEAPISSISIGKVNLIEKTYIKGVKKEELISTYKL